MEFKYNVLITKGVMEEKPSNDVFQEEIYKSGNLDKLREFLTASEIHDRLIGGCSFIGAHWKEGAKERRDINIISRSLIALDFDNFISLDTALEIAKSEELLPTIFHTSSSHGKVGKGERFRFIYATDKPITSKHEYKFNVNKLASLFGGMEEWKMEIVPNEYTEKGNPKRRKVVTREGIDPASNKLNQIMYGHCSKDKSNLISGVHTKEVWKVKKETETAKKKRREIQEKSREQGEACKSLPNAKDSFYTYSLHKAFIEGDSDLFGGAGSGTYTNYEEVAYNFKAFNKVLEFKKHLEKYERNVSQFTSILDKVCYPSNDLVNHIKENSLTKAQKNREKIVNDKDSIVMERFLEVLDKEQSKVLKEIKNGYYFNTTFNRWMVATPTIIEGLIADYFKENYNAILSDVFINNGANLIKRAKAKLEDESQQFEAHKHHIGAIGFKDGTLLLDKFKMNVEFKEGINLSKEYNSLISFPDINYKDVQEKPSESYFIDTVTKMFDPGDRLIFKRYLGSILFPAIELQICLGILGREGGEGKGSLYGALIEVLGRSYISSLNVGKWGKEHQNTAFVNKILNISQEVSTKDLESDTFKTVTGGDDITINPKNERSFSYKPTMRNLLSFNKHMQFKNLDTAIMRRMRVIEAKPRKSKSKLLHKEELMLDKVGTIYFLIAGLKDFILSGYEIPAMNKKLEREMIANNSLTYSLFEECFEEKEDATVKLSDLRKLFNDYISVNEERGSMNSKDFTNAFKTWIALNGWEVTFKERSRSIYVSGIAFNKV